MRTITQFHKTREIIKSCQTYEQLDVAYKCAQRFVGQPHREHHRAGLQVALVYKRLKLVGWRPGAPEVTL